MANLQPVQVKVTFPAELYCYIKSKADQFGLSMSAYLKNLALNDVKDMEIPVFKMSPKAEKITDKALEDFNKGKTQKITNISKYLDNL